LRGHPAPRADRKVPAIAPRPGRHPRRVRRFRLTAVAVHVHAFGPLLRSFVANVIRARLGIYSAARAALKSATNLWRDCGKNTRAALVRRRAAWIAARSVGGGRTAEHARESRVGANRRWGKAGTQRHRVRVGDGGCRFRHADGSGSLQIAVTLFLPRFVFRAFRAVRRHRLAVPLSVRAQVRRSLETERFLELSCITENGTILFNCMPNCMPFYFWVGIFQIPRFFRSV